jgi:hypothetical protein
MRVEQRSGSGCDIPHLRGSGLLTSAATACLIAGFGLLNVAEADWAHSAGILYLFGFVLLGFRAVVLTSLNE